MEQEIFLFEKNEFNQEVNQIRKDAKHIYNRLKSIIEDASFVMTVADLFPTLALVGKRIPDALSKTIPIWCCTINRAVHRIRPREAWDIDFHSLPSVVSPSEHAQIESKIELLTDKLMQSGIDLISVSDQLKKPLRPIWYTPQSSHAADFEESPFWPVICLSASEAVENGYQSRPGYLYVQGSGDDQEAWSFGLTPTLFWNHQEYILSNKTDCEERVKELVKEIGSDQNNNHSFAFIDPTTIAIGGSVSSLFDVIINCSLEQKLVSDSIDYLHLPIPEGKKGQQAFLASISKAIDFVRQPLLDKKKILIFCDTGKDHSVGIALSILVKYFDLNGQLQVKDNSRVDKKVIQHQLVRIISSWEKASPSRTTLKKVNMYFMSHSVS
ncbi:hypothetical protein G6F48_002685 [Rhizopus delemar]|nr:hypothetical protein G6F48_002685 [Rhizopus delemar]